MGAFWDAWNKQGQVNDQVAMSQIQQASGLAGLMQQAQAQQRAQQVQSLLSDPNIAPEQKRMGLMGLIRDPVQAANVMHQMETERANASLRTAQADTQRRLLAGEERKAAEERRVQGASDRLSGMLSPQISERDGQERIPFVGTEAQLVEHMKKAPGVYSLVSPAQVRGLQAIIDPKKTAEGLLSVGKQDAPYTLSPGAMRLDANGNIIAQAPFAPRQEPKTVPYSDVGRIKADVSAGLLTPSEGDAAVKALRDKQNKPSASAEKEARAKKQLASDLDRAIKEIGDVAKDGGLIDQSTGSGAGALVDQAAGFFGKSTAGADAVSRLKPIYDMALKMVPRFEGPQSDKDTRSYNEAAGRLADPSVPISQKKLAAREIVRLMKERKDQFGSKETGDLTTGRSVLEDADAILRGN